MLRDKIYKNDLSAGIAAVARAWSARRVRTPDYPGPDNAWDIIEISRMAEQEITGLSMAPLIDILENIPDKHRRKNRITNHHLLETLMELSWGMHLVIRYTLEEERDVLRLFGALHLAVCGPYPVWENYAQRNMVGCPDCIYNIKYSSGSYHTPRDLAVAARDGEFDPNYIEPMYYEGWRFGMKMGPDVRPLRVRLTWRASSQEVLSEIAKDLEKFRDAATQGPAFVVGIDTKWSTVSAEKILQNKIEAAMEWGHTRYLDRGAEWYGAERVFTP